MDNTECTPIFTSTSPASVSIILKSTTKADPLSSIPRKLVDVFSENKTVFSLYNNEEEGIVDEFELIAHSGTVDTNVADIGGLVKAAVLAYSSHHGLILRPDDVWQAISTQFSFYVVGNAEALRSKFVQHEGQKELIVQGDGGLYCADYEKLAQSMVKEISRNIKDPSVTEWLMPNFSTTTDADRVAAAISLMSTMKMYFSYKFWLKCGLPSVELLGTEADWEALLTKVKRLSAFDIDKTDEGGASGSHLKEWQSMLEPIVENMLATKRGEDNMDWWQRIAHYEGGGSGPSYLSGWITAFAVFTADGKWQGDQHEVEIFYESYESEWPLIDTANLPPTVATCPLTIDDNGIEYKANLFAGQFCCDAVDQTNIQVRNDWCLTIAKI